MAYIKQNFEDGQTLKAEHLNAMEQGIADVSKHIVVSGGDTLTWDGNTEGYVVCESGGVVIVKVSDAVPTKADFANGCTITFAENFMGDTVINLDGETAQAAFWNDGAANLGSPPVWIVPYDNYDTGDGEILPEKGVYFVFLDIPDMGSVVHSSLTIPGYTGFITEKLDPKVLPDALQFGDKEEVIFEEQTIALSAEEGGLLTFSSPIAVGDSITVEWNGTAYPCTVIKTPDFDFFGNLSATGEADDTGEPFAALSMGNMAQILSLVGEESATVKVSAIQPVKLNMRYYQTHIPLYLDFEDSKNTYLYADVALTHKVTADELRSLYQQAPIILFVAYMSQVIAVCYYPMRITVTADMGIILTTAGSHYTAEYRS